MSTGLFLGNRVGGWAALPEVTAEVPWSCREPVWGRSDEGSSEDGGPQRWGTRNVLVMSSKEGPVAVTV